MTTFIPKLGKNKKIPPPPPKKKRKNNKKTKSNLLYFRKWSFLVLKKNLFKLSSPKKLNKTFYTLDKTPFWKTGCLSNLYYILAAQASSFLIHLLWLTRNHVVPEVTTLIYFFCDLRYTMPRQRLLLLSLITFLTFGTPYSARDHHSHLPTNLYLQRRRLSLGVASIV